MSCNAKKDAFYGAPCDDIRDVSSRAISPTSFLATVLISRRTRPSEIRQMMGGVQARRRPAISSEERVREDRATERVGRLTRGSAPPPIADSSSTTATVHPAACGQLAHPGDDVLAAVVDRRLGPERQH